MAPRGCPAEFRRRAVGLVGAGRPVAQVAAGLGISDQSVCDWRRRARIDAGVEPGTATAEHAELAALRRRVRELGDRTRDLSSGDRAGQGGRRPKSKFAAVKALAAEGLPVERACGLLGVSVSGYWGWLGRPRSARSVRHAWLADAIAEVYARSRQTYGAKRVHAELVGGRGIAVCRRTVEILMRRAGLRGVSGRPRASQDSRHPDRVGPGLPRLRAGRAGPAVGGRRHRAPRPRAQGPAARWCTGAFSRRVVGWSIDSRPTASLAANAPGMAIDNRNPAADETVTHSDHRTQPASWASAQRSAGSGLLRSMGPVGDCFDSATDRVVPVPDASRAARPQALAHTRRVRRRDLRIPRNLAQPAATAHRPWHADACRVRDPTPTQTGSMNPAIRLHQTQGPPAHQARVVRDHQLRPLQNPRPALRRQTELDPARRPHPTLEREEPQNRRSEACRRPKQPPTRQILD